MSNTSQIILGLSTAVLINIFIFCRTSIVPFFVGIVRFFKSAFIKVVNSYKESQKKNAEIKLKKEQEAIKKIDTNSLEGKIVRKFK